MAFVMVRIGAIPLPVRPKWTPLQRRPRRTAETLAHRAGVPTEQKLNRRRSQKTRLFGARRAGQHRPLQST